MTLDGIRAKIAAGRYRYSDHAVKRIIKRDITRQEIEAAIGRGEIIEEYPYDKYFPGCLVHGRTDEGRELHIQVSLPPLVVVITVYEPDPASWADVIKRR